ncbi:MAG: hypothetical protein ACUVWR_19345, partial [Anaerolineae bacterium]
KKYLSDSKGLCSYRKPPTLLGHPSAAGHLVGLTDILSGNSSINRSRLLMEQLSISTRQLLLRHIAVRGAVELELAGIEIDNLIIVPAA